MPLRMVAAIALVDLGAVAASLSQIDPLTGWGELLTRLGVPGCLLLFIWGLHKEWWVMAGQYKRERQLTDKAMHVAERGTVATEASVELARKTVK